MQSVKETQKSDFKFADWVNKLAESEIRRLLRFIPKYYFAGGKPGILPINIFNEIIQNLVDEDKKRFSNIDNVLWADHYNYGRTEGNTEFREILAKRLTSNDHLTSIKPEDVTISTGSQQMLYGLSDIFINPGDIVLTTKPTYLGFIGAVEKVGGRIIQQQNSK